MINFFVQKNLSFDIVLPIDISNEESPQIVFTEGIEKYPEQLKSIPEDKLQFHWMRFRKPDWGMDCMLRELAYDGSNLRERSFSQEKLDSLRIKYLLIGSSFFPQDNQIAFVKEGGYDVLNGISETLVKSLEPFILRIFLVIASRVWDLNYPIKHLLSVEDYQLLRNDRNGLQKVLMAKGIFVKSADDIGVGDKKKSSLNPDSEKAALPTPSPEKQTG